MEVKVGIVFDYRSFSVFLYMYLKYRFITMPNKSVSLCFGGDTIANL